MPVQSVFVKKAKLPRSEEPSEPQGDAKCARRSSLVSTLYEGRVAKGTECADIIKLRGDLQQ